MDVWVLAKPGSANPFGNQYIRYIMLNLDKPEPSLCHEFYQMIRILESIRVIRG
jgi:hypothetical protein